MSAQNPVRRAPASTPLPDLQRMTRTDLLRLSVEIGRDADAIKTQLAHARTKARIEGIFAPRAWYASAEGALRTKGRQLAAVYARLAELKEQARLGRDDEEFFKVFFDLAGEMLTPSEFERIRSRASELMKAK